MIKAHHGFRHRNSIRAVLFISALAGIPLSGSAQSFPAFMATVTGRSTSIGAASNGTLIATRGTGLTAGGGWTNAGNYGVAPGAQGAVKIGAAGTVSVGGKQVPVEIGGSLGKDVIAGAIAGCASGSIAGCAIGAGVPLALAWITSSGGLRVTAGQVEVLTAGNCQEGRCYEWGDLSEPTVWYRDPMAACASVNSYVSAGNGAAYSYSMGGTFPGYSCQMQGSGNMSWHTPNIPIASRASTGDSGTWNPATPTDIKEKLIKAGAPSPMMVPELEKAGVDWNKRWPGYDVGAGTPDGGMGVPNIVGPSSIKGDTTTTTNSDGSRTTTTTSTPLTTRPGTITAGPTSSTTTTTNPDGTIRTTSTTTTEPGDTQPSGEEEKPPVDPCDEHPDRVGCLDIDVPEGKIPKETKNVTFTPSELPGVGSGQCPADVSMSFTAAPGIGAAKIINWRSFCDMALPLRAIVMSLAAIMAFFIVMPGGRVE